MSKRNELPKSSTRSYAQRWTVSPLRCKSLLFTVLLTGSYLFPGSKALAQTALDSGDAPSSYGGARHTISPALFLGTVAPDADLFVAGTDGTDDDVTGVDDEEGVTFSPSLGFPDDVHVIQSGVVNTVEVEASDAGVLNAWIDYNQDGDFDDANEHVFDDTALTAGTNSLTFNPDSRLLHGPTYARFRFSSQSGLAPTGLAIDGEVEDYAVNVAAPVSQANACATTGLLNGSFQAPDADGFTPDSSAGEDVFGESSGDLSIQVQETGVPGWNFTGDSGSNLIEIWESQHDGGFSQTLFDSFDGDQHAEINSNQTGIIFQDVVTTPGTTLAWQFYHRARVGSDTMRLRIGPVGATGIEETATSDNNGWEPYSGTYTIPANQYVTRFEFEAVSTGSGIDAAGNFVDDVKFALPPCVPVVASTIVDYGDAPDSYGTDATNNGGEGIGASHTIVSGIHLGATAPDAEADASTPLDGTGDGAEDDGVTLPASLQSGATITLPVVVTGSGALNAWIDWNGDGDFDTGEQIADDVVDGGAGDTDSTIDSTITLSITAPATATAGDTYTRFRYSSQTGLGPTGTAADGEVEDYETTIAPDPDKACPGVIADIWFANDESGSVQGGPNVNNSEFQNSLDFIYQISDQFVYDANNGMQAGLFGWALSQVNAIIPITATFGDPDDSGLLGDGNISVDSDNEGVRERYNNRLDGTGGTDLTSATAHLANLINAGNGRRVGVPQVAILMTDAFDFQMTNATSGGGNPWITAANNLRNAGPDGTNLVVVLIDTAAFEYQNDANVRSVVDAVVGDGALFISATYTEVADPVNGYIDDLAQTICDASVPVASDPNVLLVKRITRVNGETTNGSTNLDAYVDDPSYPYDDNTLDTPAPDPIDTDKWPTPISNYLKGATNGGKTRPEDEIEYTIYFLSAGDAEAVDVQICDRVPASQTYVPDAFNSVTSAPGGGPGANRGIIVEYNGTALSYTNDAGDDTAQFYPPGSTLPAACDGIPAQSEDNGTIVVNLGDLPNATGPGAPADSYGLIRFRAKVK